MFHLEDINENVPGYGSHKQSYSVRYKQPQYTKLLWTSILLDHFNQNVQFTSLEWWLMINYKWNRKLMQPSKGTLNSPSSRIVKDSTPSRHQILRCIKFDIGESSPNLFLNMVNLYLVKFEARWILNEWTFYCFIILFIWKWILT